MPALPVIPGVLKFDFVFQPTPAKPCHVRQYWKFSGSSPSNTDCVSFANGAMTALASNFPALTRPAWEYVECVVTDMSSPTSATGSSTHAVVPGTRSGETLPDDIAVLLNFHNPRRFRGGHQREYWPFGEAGDLNDQRDWTGAFLSAVNTAVTTFLTTMAALTSGGTSLAFQAGVSLYEGFTTHAGPTGRVRNIPTPRSSALIDAISFLSANASVASQRRRRGRI